MMHFLSIHARWLERIASGVKTHELRRNDRDFQVGDTLIFQCVENSDIKCPDTVITHVLTSDVCEGLEKGYCILSLTVESPLNSPK